MLASFTVLVLVYGYATKNIPMFQREFLELSKIQAIYPPCHLRAVLMGSTDLSVFRT